MTDSADSGRLDDVLRALSHRVRALRLERDLTVSALSFEAGLSESRIRAIESGRTTASLATLVALAETFEIELAHLFLDAASAPADPATSSPYVVPSALIWGGDLPPAPWMKTAAAEPAPARSPYVVPSEVVWGGDLPAAPWTTAVAAPDMPLPAAPVTTPVAHPPAAREHAYARTEQTWGGPLPPAPWLTGPTAAGAAPVHLAPVHPSAVHPVPTHPVPTHPAATHPLPTHPASAHAAFADAASAHRAAVPPVPASTPAELPTASASPARRSGRVPRTFDELREGVLRDREFRTLREFAVAAVIEAGHPLVVVARVFRLPSWRLEQWVVEASRVVG